MRVNGINLSIIVRGRKIDEYEHTDGGIYIEGRKGSEYSIRIENEQYSRRKVVVSVDGLNVISGDNDWSKGYVLESRGMIDIPGWLVNDNTAAKFEFSTVGQSYNQTGDSGSRKNVGVIGVMAFDEQLNYVLTNTYVPHTPPTIWNNPFWSPAQEVMGGDYHVTCDSYSSSLSGSNSGNLNNATVAMAACQPLSAPDVSDRQRSAPISASVNNVGTGWGDKKEFKTQTVSRTFNSYTSAMLTLHYDDARGLERRGITLKRPIREKAEAFPGYVGYCKPPR